MPADVIDLQHLARYTGGDVALNAEILRLFEMQTSELVAKLRAILEARDLKSWKEVTHTIKGAAWAHSPWPTLRLNARWSGLPIHLSRRWRSQSSQAKPKPSKPS